MIQTKDYWNFPIKVRATDISQTYGYVYDDTEEEALEKIKNGEYEVETCGWHMIDRSNFEVIEITRKPWRNSTRDQT